ncbi:hypothetical protein CR513_26640, partial [Mucuna pruriens]
MEVEIQHEALTTLVQFYDPPLRTFLFQDFQMAPTLDEYERILDQPLIKNPPYLYQGNFPSWGRVAKLLKTVDSEVMARKQNRRLAIYDVILLLHLDEYVDLASIYVFLANQEQARNLVIVVLANTFYTIHRCHERRGGRLICCLQALYIWLMTHGRGITTRPIEDLKWCWIKKKTGKKWAQFLQELTDKVIRWSPK